jgi:hypothetical protein
MVNHLTAEEQSTSDPKWSSANQLLAGLLNQEVSLPSGLTELLTHKVKRLVQAIAAGRSSLASQVVTAAAPVLWAIWDATGLADQWQEQALRSGPAGQRADADLDAVLALFAACVRYDSRRPGSGVGGFLDYLDAQELPSDTVAPHAPAGDRVIVSTATAAVGREWDLVVVAGLEEEVWPNLRLRDAFLGAGLLADLVDGKEAPEDPSERRKAVLEDETRMLLLAVTRAKREVFGVAVANNDQRPSRFFAWLGGTDPAVEATQTAAEALPFDLRGLVARARAAAIDKTDPVAVQVLALLALLGVDGADPESWPGVLERSSQEPIFSPDLKPLLSPSSLEVLANCPLRWALDRAGAKTPVGAAASLGSLIHELAEEFGHEVAQAAQQTDQPPMALEDLKAQMAEALDIKWETLGFENNYSARALRLRAEQMVNRLAVYLHSRSHLKQVGLELWFKPTRQLNPQKQLPVLLRGRIDRLEIDSEGRALVVDFKTTQAGPISVKDAAVNPQLGAYQMALEAGWVEGFEAASSGGAKLVYLGSVDRQNRPIERKQNPPAQGSTPHWMEDLLVQCGVDASRSWFEARPGKNCRICDVKASCPVQVEGKQVTA